MSQYNGNTTFYKKAAAETLTLRDVFSDVFKKHKRGDGIRQFMAGTELTTPAPIDMLRTWQRPWLFARFLGVGVAFLVMIYCIVLFAPIKHSVLVVVFSVFGAAVVPLAVLIFFWEMNIPRNVPIYEVLMIFFIGGALSMFITGVLFPALHLLLPGDMPAWLAPVAEEPAKFLALLPFLLRKKEKGVDKQSFVLTGVLIGAAVGAGFEVFESAGYDLESFYGYLDYGSVSTFNEGMLTPLLRMFPNAHTMWAALYGGALAWVIGSDKVQLKHFIDKRFLAFFGAAFAIHAFNNQSLVREWVLGIWLNANPGATQASAKTFIYFYQFGEMLLLTVVCWLLMIYLLRKGIQQVLAASNAYLPAPQPVPVYAGVNAPASAASLYCVSGEMAGQAFPLVGGALTLGRDPSVCNLLFSASTPGISRRHCTITSDARGVSVTDSGSSQGTFLGDGRRLTAGVPEILRPGQRFYMASAQTMFEVRS